MSPSPATLAGAVVLQDSWANRLSDFSGVEVSLDGASTETVTDNSGAWHIDGVPSGRHDITFKKSAFGTVRVLGQTVTGPSTKAPNVTMAITPWQQAIIDSVRVVVLPQTGKDYYFIDGHLSATPPPNASFVTTVAFVGNTAAVSSDTASYDRWNQFLDPTGQLSRFSIVLSADDMRSTFGVGGQAFVSAYVSASACSCYPDQATAKPFFSNIGPRANVVQLTIK